MVCCLGKRQTFLEVAAQFAAYLGTIRGLDQILATTGFENQTIIRLSCFISPYRRHPVHCS